MEKGVRISNQKIFLLLNSAAEERVHTLLYATDARRGFLFVYNFFLQRNYVIGKTNVASPIDGREFLTGKRFRFHYTSLRRAYTRTRGATCNVFRQRIRTTR